MKVFVLLFVLFALPCAAEEWTPALPTHTGQKIADVASYGTLGAGLALETWDAFHCADKTSCVLGEVFKIGVTVAATFGVKQSVKRMRPCAPACGIDSPDSSFPSGHAALAGQTVEGKRYGLKAILAGTTAGLRLAANKHHISDVVAGFGIGFTTTLVW